MMTLMPVTADVDYFLAMLCHADYSGHYRWVTILIGNYIHALINYYKLFCYTIIVSSDFVIVR
jgi:hypothetical protein